MFRIETVCLKRMVLPENQFKYKKFQKTSSVQHISDITICRFEMSRKWTLQDIPLEILQCITGYTAQKNEVFY